MPRRARLAVPGIPWHIIQRGNNRSACFYSTDDYLFYLRTLEEQARKYGCAIHAYCLMTNHVHLLLTPERKESAGQAMKNLGQRYVQYINRTYRRSGTLWEGRFRSCLVQEERYLLTCCRYIELNPVRAGMVEHPANYKWSSYRFNGQGDPDTLLTSHSLFLAMGSSIEERCKRYRELFRNHLEPGFVDEIRKATNSNHALGNNRFSREIETILQRRATPGTPGRPVKTK
jgi:putative transposase